MRWFVALTLFALTACGSGEIAPSYRGIPSTDWAEPDAYSFSLESRCGERALIGRFAVTVEDGVVVAAQALDGDGEAMLEHSGIDPIPTLAEILDEVRRAETDADRVDAEFDPDDGHPVSVDIDWHQNAIDDESCYEITEYGVTQPIREAPPGVLIAPKCDDNALCASGFTLDGTFYALSCAAVQDDLVTTNEIGSGSLYGEDVTVNLIEGVEPTLIVAVSIPGGDCSEVDPAEVHTAWSMAFPGETDQKILQDAICTVGALSPSQYLADRCHLSGELFSCGLGPAFPESVLEDLSAFPEPAEAYGADVSLILGSDEPDDLLEWHVIVEDIDEAGEYVQLLLRHDPESNELQYILDGSGEDFSSPRPCEIEPVG